MYTKKQLKVFSEFFEWDFLRVPEKCNLKKSPLKDLLIADVHTPFHHKEILAQTIEDNLDAQNIWIAGDWWDFYSKSFYRKEVDIRFEVEFREGFAELWKLSDKFEKIYIMLSNHDMRFAKWLYDHVPTEALPFTDSKSPEKLLQTIPNLTIINQKCIRDREVEYIHQYKNMLITHIEMSRKDPIKAVIDIEKELQKWTEVFKFSDYDMLLQAHNHNSGKIKFGSRYLFGIPCMIDIGQPAFNYVFRGKLQGNPPALGYVVLDKYETGHFNPKKSHIIDY